MGGGHPARVRPGGFSSGCATASSRPARHGYSELPILGDQVVATESLPPIHKDPFDRVLVAQATVEGITLLTCDSLVAQYPGPIRAV